MDRLTTDEGAGRDRSAEAMTVRRIAQGDPAAVAELYDRYANAVYSLACRILGPSADAEDVVQEVFTQAWRQADRYDAARASAAAWLLNITRTRAIDRLRANRTRQRISGDDDQIQVTAASGRDQEQGVIDIERAQRVRAALNRLGLPQRQAIDLAYFSGLTHGEIAARLEEPLGTIKTRIRSGLLKLREALMDSK